MEPQKITIQNELGEEQEVNLVTILTSNRLSSSYLVYMENEITDGDNEVLFAKIVEKDDKLTLEAITSIEEKEEVRYLFRREGEE